MDILTKICVVVLVVLNLLAVPVFLKGILVPENYKFMYEQAQEQSDANALTATSAKRDYQSATEEKLTLQKVLQASEAKYREQILDLTNQLESEQLKSGDLGAKFASINLQMVDLNSNYQRYIDRAKLFSDRISQQQSMIDRLTSESVDLYDQLMQKTADYERIGLIAKGLREQISELQETVDEQARQIEGMRVGGPGVPTVTRTPQPIKAEPIINGTITAVITDDNLASINIGSANGVKRGMEMVVMRGSEFVGYLRIEEVDLTTSAGIIVEKILAPAQGDKVVTKTSLYR